MQNKSNFRNDKMNITLDMASKYKIISAGSGQKTKPIQIQFNERPKMNADLVEICERIDRMIKVYLREAL